MNDRAELILRELISAVETWMEYMRIVICTPKLLAEHSLCTPICEYLERKDGVELELEKKHPDFAKKRVDIFWSYLQENYYMELKLASGYSSEILSDYFDDLCRLSLLCNESTHCFFLLSGRSDDFLAAFYNTKGKRKRNRKICKWLSLGSIDSADAERTIYMNLNLFENKIKTQKNTIIDCYELFLNEYQLAYEKQHPNAQLSDNMNHFRTKLRYYNLLESKNTPKNLTAIWEVYRIDN